MLKEKPIYSYLFAILGLLFLFSCDNTKDKQEKKNSILADSIVNGLPKKKNIEHQSDTARKIIELVQKNSGSLKEALSPSFIDTASLGVFWRTFQRDIATNNKKGVVHALEFPIHAIFLITFQFSYDCDTAKFIRNEKKYLTVDIDKNNVQQHYDLIFSEILKEMLLSTSVKDLMEKRLESSNNEVIYPFFVRDYVPNGKCYFDHRIYFYFQQIDNNWLIAISGE